MDMPEIISQGHRLFLWFHLCIPFLKAHHIHVHSVLCHMYNSLLSYALTGSPNCPTVNTTVNTESLAVSIHKSLWRWLPEWYHVEVSSHFNGSIAIVYNSTLNGSTSHHLRRPHLSLKQCTTSLPSHATWWDAMSHVMYSQPKHHKQAMKVRLYAHVRIPTHMSLWPV